MSVTAVFMAEPPHALPIFSGEELGPDLTYGPVRVLTPAEVRDAAGLLTATPAESLLAHYSAVRFEDAEIFPSGVWEAEGDEARGWLAEAYAALQRFYQQAAARGDAVLLAVT